MRRGHTGHLGLGGWRNDNPRHFRPRTGGNQHFRPPRGYGLLDQHRFPPPPSRPHRPSQSFKQRSGGNEHMRHDHHDRKYRSEYRQNNYSRSQDEGLQTPEKQPYPLLPLMRSSDSSFGTPYPKPSTNYYEGLSKHCHMNNMGDIDDRYIPPREPFRQHQNPWANDNLNQFDDRHKYDHSKGHRYDERQAGESSKLPLYDYTGHRPPANDHYGGNPTPVINNSESFNRSVDDTVNIIRKRLLNRNDPNTEHSEPNYNQPTENPVVDKSKERTQNFNNETVKKKVPRQKHTDKSNSDASFTKIKSKIVNQLFKMDKDKIHKLMDNPTSSSKFEYAISSLITESQYSFNRHLRSVAEKSLPSSSSIDFIQNDTNTIYEDTFMKQMQCILDPQDTVLLEDLKPIVMAELSKALQLDEYEHGFDVGNEDHYQDAYDQQHCSNEYYDNLYNYEEYAQYSGMPEQELERKYSPLEMDYRQYEDPPQEVREVEKSDDKSCENNDSHFETKSRRRSRTISQDRMHTPESPPPVHTRKSLDERLNELQFSAMIANNEPENSIFNTNADTQLDDDVTFEEFDKQYHVAVDEFFINNEDDLITSAHADKKSVQTKPPETNTNTIALNLNPLEKDSNTIKEQIDHQLQDIASSSLELPLIINSQIKKDKEESNKELVLVKQDSKLPAENQSLQLKIGNNNNNQASKETQNTCIEKPQCSKTKEDTELKRVKKSEKGDTSHVTNKTSATLSSRKRSIDQSPSHHKEKRKKSESVHNDSDKQLQDRNIIINPLDNSSKTPKKDDKKAFPEKHTKRKESHKNSYQKDNEKKNSSTDTLNSSLSPKEINNTINNSKVHNKSDVKATLKTFDIFTEQPKKVNLHQSHRNTAIPAVNNVKTITKPKMKQANKVNERHASVQVLKKFLCKEIQTSDSKSTICRFTQTERKRLCTKSTQTDAAHVAKRKDSTRSTDTLERMKEIDLEIQVLLQEKFKLYNSIESKESGSNSLHSLGMAVVNVAPTEDTIVDDFTSIPAEELEQIALESVEEKKEVDYPKPETRNTRLRALSKEKSKSQSPVPASQKRSKRGKTPNISLIEQIINDDRPIEDIISLDDLEEPSPRPRGKNSKTKKKMKKKGPISSQPQTPAVSIDSNDYMLKDCTVLIVREDFSKYLPTTEQTVVSSESQESSENQPIVVPQDSLPEEVNDIQFDMLDVSEDIVIGDVCEVKSIEDKEESDTAEVPISEEIILDNSQSSMEDQQCTSSEPKENECKMFDYSADENLRKDSVVVTGNADAVLAIECIENNFIAACLDGNVYYFSGDGQLITTLRGSNLAVTCLTIVKEKYGTTVYTGSLDSRIRYYDLDTGLEKGPECNVLSPIQTMDRAWDTVFVGTRTGFVLQFECKNNMLIPISTVQFSEQSILALRAMKEGPRKVLLVAARSEDVTIKDAQTGLLLRTLAGPKMTVYTLLYEDGKVYCGTSSNQIHVFDYSSGSHVGAHEGGKGAVCLRACGGLVFAGCYDGCVYVFREGERRPFAQLRGPGLMLLSLAVVGTKIIAGYKDRSLYIWKIPLSILQEMIL